MRQADRRLGLSATVASRLEDGRQPGKVRQRMVDLVRQRVFAIGPGLVRISTTTRRCVTIRASRQRWSVTRPRPVLRIRAGSRTAPPVGLSVRRTVFIGQNSSHPPALAALQERWHAAVQGNEMGESPEMSVAQRVARVQLIALSKGNVERRVRDQRAICDPAGQVFKNLEALHAWTDSRLAERSARRRCPVTGTMVAEAWDHERTLLTPLPETWPEPFDIVVDRPVSHDALVNFEGRQYSVPFRFADQTGRSARSGQQRPDPEGLQSHYQPSPRHRGLVKDDRHYEGDRQYGPCCGPTTAGTPGPVSAGVAAIPVARRSVDLYAALAEVAR